MSSSTSWGKYPLLLLPYFSNYFGDWPIPSYLQERCTMLIWYTKTVCWARFVCDDLDGRFARMLNQTSTLGIVLDMVTDRWGSLNILSIYCKC